jgi:3'(2'), 5'-bisphosphate nucleotidase
MIGLCVDGRPHMGVVYVPGVDELFFAVKGQGAYKIKDGLNQEPDARIITQIHAQPITDTTQIINLGSRSHYDARVETVLQKLNSDKQVIVGSFGIKVCL